MKTYAPSENSISVTTMFPYDKYHILCYNRTAAVVKNGLGVGFEGLILISHLSQDSFSSS